MLLAYMAYHMIKEHRSVNLVSTSWHCETIKTGFASQAYSEYRSVLEKMTLTFTSRHHFSIREFVQVTDMKGQIDKLENFYFGSYDLEGDELAMKFETVKQNVTHHDPVLNSDYKEYEGLTIRYALSMTARNLFFYAKNRSEIFNLVCFSPS